MAPTADDYEEDVSIEPDTFDAVLLGTGLQESLVAAAAASTGRTVLHLDHAPHYGAQYASMNLEALGEWIAARNESASAADAPPSPPVAAGEVGEGPEGEVRVAVDPVAGVAALYGRVELDDVVGAENRDLLGNTRRYSLDLCGPKLAYSAGHFVDTLIRSGAHQYLEFKALEGTLILRPTGLSLVPCSRAELFKDRSLSAVEKRMLMKFLQACMEQQVLPEGGTGPRPLVSESSEASIAPQSGREVVGAAQGVLADLAEPFIATLRRFGLSEAVQQVVLYALTLIHTDQAVAEASGTAVTAEEGVRVLQLHMHSTGRYGQGQGAFLVPLYGTGELPQAFCRLAAVKGAIYVLRRQAAEIRLSRTAAPGPAASADPSAAPAPAAPAAADGDGDGTHPWRCCGIKTRGGQELNCGALLANLAYTESSAAGAFQPGFPAGSAAAPPPPRRYIARCICIADRSLAEGKSQLLVVLPPGWTTEAVHAVRGLQVGEASSVAPEGKCVVYLSTVCRARDCAKSGVELLKEAVERLFRRWQHPAEAEVEAAVPAADSTQAAAALDRPIDSAPTTSVCVAPAESDCRPRLLWALYYEQAEGDMHGDEAAGGMHAGERGTVSDLPKGMAVGGLPGDVLDLDVAVREAERTFRVLFPDKEFFPAPKEEAEESAEQGDLEDDHEIDSMLSNMQPLSNNSGSDASAVPDPDSAADEHLTVNEDSSRPK